MSKQTSARHARIAFALVAAIGSSAVGTVVDLATPASAQAASCFVVAQKLNCIDGAGTVPIMPIGPQIMPAGIGVEGESHDLVVEDDGGYEVARG